MSLLGTVGQRVRSLREEKRLGQVDLAEAAGVSVRQIARIEAGTANLTLETLDAVAGALGVKAAALLPATGTTGQPRSIERLLHAFESLPESELEALLRFSRALARSRLPLSRLLDFLQEERSGT